MPTFIKTGFWDKKAKAPDGWLDLNLFVETLIPPTPPSTNIYNSDGTLTSSRTLSGTFNESLNFNNLDSFYAFTGNTSLNQFSILNLSNNGVQFVSLKPGTIENTLQLFYNILQTSFYDYSVNQNFIGGLLFSYQDKKYEFGQITGGNTTTLKIDDAAAFPVQVSGTNVTQNTSGTASGKFLKIKVDGVDYVIELKNPS